MTTTNTHPVPTQTPSSAASRTSGTPHIFVTPVVREMPLPTNPGSFASCW